MGFHKVSVPLIAVAPSRYYYLLEVKRNPVEPVIGNVEPDRIEASFTR
jgi:hypothetical protein